MLQLIWTVYNLVFIGQSGFDNVIPVNRDALRRGFKGKKLIFRGDARSARGIATNLA